MKNFTVKLCGEPFLMFGREREGPVDLQGAKGIYSSSPEIPYGETLWKEIKALLYRIFPISDHPDFATEQYPHFKCELHHQLQS